jgi:hypothetical protein
MGLALVAMWRSVLRTLYFHKRMKFMSMRRPPLNSLPLLPSVEFKYQLSSP